MIGQGKGSSGDRGGARSLGVRVCGGSCNNVRFARFIQYASRATTANHRRLLKFVSQAWFGVHKGGQFPVARTPNDEQNQLYYGLLNHEEPRQLFCPFFAAFYSCPKQSRSQLPAPGLALSVQVKLQQLCARPPMPAKIAE